MRYYSIQPSEMENLDNDYANKLLECIPIIDAREALVGIKIAEYPYLKPEGQKKTFRDLKKQANPTILKREARAITTIELAQLLSKGS